MMGGDDLLSQITFDWMRLHQSSEDAQRFTQMFSGSAGWDDDFIVGEAKLGKTEMSQQLLDGPAPKLEDFGDALAFSIEVRV